ncbi:MAG: glucose dehydrogenase [Clostridia bacterium]|nr:glucose dehydrogenase [Clostridia bacterium]
MPSRGFLLRGLVSGLFASLILIFAFWGIWLLPALGLILTRVSLINGTIVAAVMGVIGGLIYSVFVREKQLEPRKSIVAGSLLGLAFWVGGVLTLVPMMLGFPPSLSSPRDHLTALVIFVVYGISLAFMYRGFQAKMSKKNLGYGVGLVVLTLIATPLLLRGAVSTNPQDLDLPTGYKAQVIAKDLTYPTGIAMDEKGEIYIAESGFSYGPKTTEAKIMRLNDKGKPVKVADKFEGPIGGITYKEGNLYVSHRGKITELELKTGERRDLVTNLPSLGDHQNGDLMFGPDGAIYFGQGTATNAGVVGSDNFVYAWADRYPDFHDIPSRDFTLTGENYTSLDLKETDPAAKKTTGAFIAFGKTRKAGEKVKGKVPASGAVHRLDMEDGTLSIFADGLRNPYGLTQDEDGNMYASVLGYDDRGVRASTDSPDWIMKLEKGAWYGWPDYAGTVPLTDEKFASDRGINRNPIIKDPPEVTPPLASLPSHYSPMKIDCAPKEFGMDGIFVAVFGDGQPLTQDLKKLAPSGVLVVDQETGSYDWFLKSKNKARAGRRGDGLKRVVDVKFDRDGKSLYVLDFGVFELADMAPNAIPKTGVLWKITKE